ncbi:MAG: Dabb family protein [Chloroflexota bacterium]|nr:Dabb family protein [Chloroflexota bacterium]
MGSDGSQALYHILMWNYKDEVSQEQRAALEAELASLPEKIPSLNGVHFGPVVGGRNQSYSHCFVMLFDSEAGLAEYTTHPDHVHFAGPFREACSAQAVVDMEPRL